jgi:signal peptidase I
MTATAIVGAVLAGLGVAGGGSAVMLRRRFTIITVRGSSMTPTYADGERLLVRRTAEYGRGDVMVFAMPPSQQVDGMKWLLKRVTAVAGEAAPADVRPVTGAGNVPAGCVVVHGDGLASLDSRQLGYIPVATGLGIVIRRLGDPR